MGYTAIKCQECMLDKDQWDGCAHVQCPCRRVLSAQVRDDASSDPCVTGTYRAEPHIDGDSDA